MDVMEDRGVDAVRGPSEVNGGLGADKKAVAFVFPTAACKEECSACASLAVGRGLRSIGGLLVLVASLLGVALLVGSLLTLPCDDCLLLSDLLSPFTRLSLSRLWLSRLCSRLSRFRGGGGVLQATLFKFTCKRNKLIYN